MTEFQFQNFNKNEQGAILPALLIIGASFVIVIYGLLFVLTLQFDFARRQVASERALNIAEAGIEYYRWHLAHDPDDYQDGTGGPGPYVHDYLDPQGASIGQFSLQIDPPSAGSTIVTIRSTGESSEFPNVRRTIKVQYGTPSFAEFAFLSNGSYWYGTGSVVNGKVHSNNGIRMDGTNNSVVSSAQATYMCGTETGCFPPESKPGVWGSGGDQSLWQFPVSSVDFDSISFDFASMKTSAQSDGLYLDNAPSGIGYHLVFDSGGNVTVYDVTDTDTIRGYSIPGQGVGQQGIGGCRRLDQLIASEVQLGTYDLASNPIIFVEDDLWIEGTVNGRVTVAAVRFPIQSSDAIIWIKDNIQYNTYDGSTALGLIAQSDMYIVRDVPDDFKLDGVLMSQKGKIIRHGYFDWCEGTQGAVKQKLTMNGSLISYFKPYWNFGSAPDSGFVERELNYDTNVLYNPPPYFPTTGQSEFISWVEE